ncbi:MAG: glycosyl hydrolase [Haloarculaceae archaeon]
MTDPDGTSETDDSTSETDDGTAGGPASIDPPSVAAAAEELAVPDPAPEAVAVYRYLHDVWGERVLSGQQYEPDWGDDELDHVESVTGRLPALMGSDFIHDDAAKPVERARDWWERGGVPTLMWHWGAPGETHENEYQRSLTENVDVDLADVLDPGTAEHEEFRDGLAEVADRLGELRDDGVPVLWRPFHEFEGGWFWWGSGEPGQFVDLWERTFEYFTEERGLDNLVWVLCHTGEPDGDWVPDESTFDLVGGDTYPAGPGPNADIYDALVDIHGEDRPIAFHEVGTPPRPDDCVEADTWWAWWMQWHGDWLFDETGEEYLREVYDSDLVVTLEDLPDVVAEYGPADG